MTLAHSLIPDSKEPESRYRFITDDEAATLYGVPRDEWRKLCMMYDADKRQGFPQKHFVLKRRWLPALDDFFNQTNRPKIVALEEFRKP